MNESEYEALQKITANCTEKDQNDTNLCGECERDFLINTEHSDCLENEHCSILDDKNNCTECYPPFLLDENTCIKKVFCKGMKDGKCEECEYYYHPNDQGDCKRITIKNCLQVNSTGCKLCEPYYYIDNDKCSPYPDNCLIVENKECKKCVDKYYENGLECTPYPLHCDQIDKDTKKCSNCTSFYYLDNEKVCNPYPSNCSVINEETKECKTCFKYYYLEGKKCEPFPSYCENINQETKKCIECKPLYYLFNEQCKPIPDNCRVMDNNTEICDECKEYYYLDGKECKAFPEHCKNFDNKTMECQECDYGYYPDGKECKPLPDHCSKVGKDTGRCNTCMPSYFLNSWVECESKPENCLVFDYYRYKCKECIRYYYLEDDHTCLPYPENCVVVNETTKQCVQCNYTYELDDKNNCIQNQEHCGFMNETTKKCYRCVESYYLDKNSKCLKKPEHCIEVKPEWENCTSCAGYYYPDGLECKPYPSNCVKIDDTTKKCQQCDFEYYLKNDECKPNPKYCSFVDNSTEECMECYKHYYLDDKSNCIEYPKHCIDIDIGKTNECTQCEKYFYLNEGQCKPYPDNCLEIYDDTKKCKNCNITYYLYNGECKPNPEHCAFVNNFTEHCMGCYPHYYLNDDDKCIEFPIHCIDVDHVYKNCTDCYGYYYPEGLECKPYPDYCTSINKETKKCITCDKSHYLYNGECKPIPDHCISVNNSTEKCIQCISHYYLYNDICTENPQHCETVDNETQKCTDCDEFYFLNAEKICIPYPDHCIQVNDSNVCLKCDNFYYLNDKNKCIPYPDHCIQMNETNVCIQCEIYYHLEGSICKENPSHCRTIDYLPQKCKDCDSGYYPKSRVKCEQLPEGCRTINPQTNKCQICESFYYLEEGICKPYSDHCIEIDSNNKSCIRCDYKYYYIKNGKCEPYPDHCIEMNEDHNKCLACSDENKFYIDNDKCVDNPPYCQIFDKENKNCTKCQDTHYLDDKKCILKPAYCQEVDSSTKKCKNCIDGYYVLNGECKLICTETGVICNECDKYYASFDYGEKCDILDEDMEPKEYELKITREHNQKYKKKLGNKGMMYFATDYNDEKKGLFDINDIEEKTKFSTKVTDEKNKEHDVDCKLFKLFNEQIVILCNLKEDLELGEHQLTLANYTLSLNNIQFHIKSETYIEVIQYNYSLPFLYSAPIIINLDDNQKTYNLKFKSYGYDDNNIIYISGNSTYAIFDKSTFENNELICEISREKLESILVNNNGIFMLGTMNDNFGSFTFDLIYIYMYYDIKQKIDIEVTITSLLSKKAFSRTAFAYETKTEIDINTISGLTTKGFPLTFVNGYKITCHFKKNDKIASLLLICSSQEEGEIYLGELKDYNYFNSIHYKYNFNIHPAENNERITIKSTGEDLDFVNPGELDLTSGKSLTIRYLVDSPSSIKNIKLNPDSDSYLECQQLTDMIKCTVPLSHFQGKVKGVNEFRTLQCIDSKFCSEMYNIDPIKVNLPEIATMKIQNDNNDLNSIKIGKKGVIYLATNFNDDNNKFDQAILDKTTFDGIFVDEDEKENTYKSSCKLWKSVKKMNVLCQLGEELKKENQVIYLKQTSFVYPGANNNNIGVIISYEAESINVKQLKSEISFLYADKQNIDIVDNKNTYELVFKKYSRDNGPLYLYSDNIKSIILDSCSNGDNQLSCTVSKDSLLEILSKSGEVFSVGEKYDNNGIYKFNSVLDITITSQIPKKEIKFKITKLLTDTVSKNEFIAYETDANIDGAKTITSNYFYIDSGVSNGKKYCLFKKSTNQNKLLLLCDAKESGSGSLGRVKTVKYDNINALYDLTIEESENIETYNVLSYEGTKVYSVYPLVLNFNNKDEYIIQYEADYPSNYKGIKLNNESNSELECETKDGYRQCKVNQDHFSSNGNYYTYHSIGIGEEAISYELPMINVVLKEKPNDGDNAKDKEESSSDMGLIIGLSVAGGVIVLAVVIFLIWHYCRKKDSDGFDTDGSKNKLLTSS